MKTLAFAFLASVFLFTLGSLNGLQKQENRIPASVPSTHDESLLSKDGDAIAVVEGQRISLAEVDSVFSLEMKSLKHRMYLLRQKALQRLVLRTLLDEKARRQGISSEHLLLEVLASLKVTEQDVEAEYKKVVARHAPPPGGEVEAKRWLRSLMDEGARVTALRVATEDVLENSEIEIFLESPRDVTFDVAAGPTVGTTDALVTIAVYFDYQCSFCKETNRLLDQLLEKYNDKIRVVYKFFPLRKHPVAFLAAQAALCADQRGMFRRFHASIFSHNGEISREIILSKASVLGLRDVGFEACLDSELSRKAVNMDLTEARKNSITSTPTLVIDGLIWQGSRKWTNLDMAIGWQIFQNEHSKVISRIRAHTFLNR